MKDKILRIQWSEPIELNELLESDIAELQGLYYITRIFGTKETSLYLGIATGNNTVKNRLRSHKKEWLYQYRGKIYVRIGRIVYPRNYDDVMIDHAESAILYEQSNVFYENTCKTKSYTYTELYRIENIGNIFELKEKIRMHEQD